MSKKYPNIGKIENRDKNNCARCKCGEIGKRKVHIQWSWFRGEDDVVWACVEHAKNIDYLTTVLEQRND